MIKAPIEPALIKVAYPFVGLVFALADSLEPVKTEHRNKCQRHNQRAQHGENHGVRHWVKELSGSAAERIDGKVAGDDNGRGVENGAVDIFGRFDDYFE